LGVSLHLAFGRSFNNEAQLAKALVTISLLKGFVKVHPDVGGLSSHQSLKTVIKTPDAQLVKETDFGMKIKHLHRVDELRK
jgi:hypothetical protein